MARKKKEQKEDGLTNLESKIIELEAKIAEKACFGLIIDDNQACLDCPHNKACPEFVDARLALEEESLWQQEVDEELSLITSAPEQQVAQSQEQGSFDWGKAIAKVIEVQPKDIGGVITTLISIGSDEKIAERSAPIIIKKLVGFGLISDGNPDKHLNWVKK